MPKKTIDKFKVGRRKVEVHQEGDTTMILDGSGKEILSLKENLRGSWSERRIVEFMLKAYDKGIRDAKKNASTVQKVDMVTVKEPIEGN